MLYNILYLSFWLQGAVAVYWYTAYGGAACAHRRIHIISGAPMSQHEPEGTTGHRRDGGAGAGGPAGALLLRRGADVG